ncbi:MAG: S8 family serine peptidase, partial [Candidatus Thermoplasmatota archaeon]
MRAKEVIAALSLCMASILVIGSVAGVISFEDAPEVEQLEIGEYSLIEKPEGMSPDELGLEVVEDYGSYLLVEPGSGEKQLEQSIDVQPLENRNELNIKGHEFNTAEGLPELNSELTIQEYEPQTEGLYIVDMVGPVSPEWREELEDMGVEIINYQPNYAYEVKMTPELAEEVEDKYFVDWTGVYQPAFKLDEDLEPGLVNIELVDGVDLQTLDDFNSQINVLSAVDVSEDRARVVAEVEDESLFSQIARNEEVYYISNEMEPRLYDEMATQIIGGGLWIYDDDDNPDTPYRVHGDYGSYANQVGYDGSGVVTAIADTGLGDGTTPNAGHDDFTGRVVGGYDFESESSAEGEWNDAHGHGTHCAGSVGGDTYHGTGENYYEGYYAGQGSAPETELFSVRIFGDDAGWVGPSDYKEIVTKAREESNAYVHSNSWGGEANGAYDESDVAYDEAVRDAGDGEPMVITVAAGNDGPGGWGGSYNSIGSPGNAKNVITVGATENYNPNEDVTDPEAIAGFSSRGWTDDNRVKPDVVAPGEAIYSTKPDGGYQSMSGTSMANPATAGASSVVVDWYEDNYGVKPNPSMVKGLLINTAYSIENNQANTGENSPHLPNQDEGWGMVDLHSIVDSPVDFMLEDETSLLETGDVDEYGVTPQDTNEPLKITLAWTDNEAQSGDNSTLKNDLNLEIISPSGDVYRGNNLVDSWSETGEDTYDTFDTSGDGWDDSNNVENVYIHPDDLEDGTYTVRVHGYNVPEDANNDGTANQDYSLVKYNAQEGGGGGGNTPPTADFSYSPTNPNPGETVQFTDASSDSDGSISSYSWDFGDGSSSTASDPSHAYSSSGTYTVELTVTDDDGATDSSTQDIAVQSDSSGYCDVDGGDTSYEEYITN